MVSSAFDSGNRQVRFTLEELSALFSEESAAADGAVAFLLHRDGKRWAAVHRLPAGAMVTLGRVASNEIQVRDDRCSRQHCAVYDHGGVWYVRDLGSRNGTRINGEKIAAAVVLHSGDRIRIGRTHFLFTDDLSSATSEPAAGDTDAGEMTDE